LYWWTLRTQVKLHANIAETINGGGSYPVVYKNGCINKCREVKQIVAERLSGLQLPIDWVILSETEEREVAFVRKEGAVKLVSNKLERL